MTQPEIEINQWYTSRVGGSGMFGAIIDQLEEQLRNLVRYMNKINYL